MGESSGEAARRLADIARSRALEAEQARRLPDEFVDAVFAARFFDLYTSPDQGGLGLDPIEAGAALETIAHGDGSAGWVTMILNGSFMTGWLPEETSTRIRAGGDFALAGMFAPIGRAIPDGDDYRITGRWPFNSGSVHATWALGGVLIEDGDGVRMHDSGMPDWRFAIFPMADAEIHDTWRASGLRATSSHDVSVDGLHVPADLLPSPILEPPVSIEGPRRHLSFFSQLASLIGGVPLGIARRALDEINEIATTRGRSGRPPMIQNSDVKLDLLGCEAALRAARAGFVDAISSVWETALRDERPSLDQRIAVRLATWQVGRTSVEVVDTCFRHGGGSALYDDVPLQRCWRDVHAATHHIFFSKDQIVDISDVIYGDAEDSLLI